MLALLAASLSFLAPGAGAQGVLIPELSISPASAAEGQPLRFEVSLSRASGQDVSVEWRIGEDPSVGAVQATAGFDYAAASATGTLTVHAGSTTAWIVVPTSQDAVYEGDETFGLRLEGVTGVARLSSADRAVGTITEDDAAPAVSVKQAQVTLEGGSADEPAEMSFRVNLSTLSGLPVTVPYTLGGTATAGADYVDPDPKSIVIPAGELSGDIVITTLPDAVGEDHESVVVTLGQPTNGVLSANAGERSATGRIYDDDRSGHAVITVSPAEVPEGVQAKLTYTLTITLGGGAAAESEVSTRVEVGGFVVGDSAHTATAGSDVVLSNVDEGVERPDVTLTIAAGETSTSRVFNAAVVADSLDEFDEAVGFGHPTTSVGQTGVYLGEENGYSYFYPRLIIRDDDSGMAPSVSVEAPAAAVAEGDDLAATTDMVFNVDLSAASGKEVTVYYSMGGTATADADYDAPPLSLTIPAGQTRGKIVVPVRGDTIDEGAGEQVVVTLLSSFNAALSAQAGATVAEGLITDDDAAPAITVADAAAVDEGETAAFAVSLSAVSGQDVAFQWQTVDDAGGTHPAAAGDDYVAVAPRTVVIPAGASGVELAVETVDDETDEYAETFLVRLSSPQGATLAPAGHEATATINADASDAAPSATIADASDVTEGNDPNATTDMTFTVSLSAVSGKPVSVDFAISSDTATAGVDYTAPSSTSLSIAAGQRSATITVQVKGDLEEELHEVLTVTLSNPTNAGLGDPHTASGRILDDEQDRGRPYVGIQIEEASIIEGEDVTVKVVASWASREDIDVNFYVSYKHHTPYWEGGIHNGRPERGAWFADERGVGLQIATIPAGQQTVEFTIETRQDQADLDGEIWAAMLTPGLIKTEGIRNIGNPNGSLDPYYPDWDSLPYLTSALDFDRVKVHDGNDPVSPRFAISFLNSLNSQSITAGEPATFRLLADALTPAPITVSYSVESGGDASVLSAGAAGNKTVTVPAGARVGYISVPTVNTGSGDDATLTVRLIRGAYTRHASESAIATNERHSASASVTVHDDTPSSSTPVVTIASGGDVAEGGSLTFTVTANPTPTEQIPVTVETRVIGDFGVSYGTALRGYWINAVNLLAGESTKTITLSSADDNIDEPDGSVRIQLHPNKFYRVGSSHAATAAVADNDDPGSTPEVSISGGSSVTEGEHASFTVTANPAPTVAFDVDLSVTASGDFGVATGQRQASLTIPPSGSATFSVSTVDDQIDEADGSATVTLESGTGYTVSSSSGSATVAVADNDVGPVVTISAGPEVTEGERASFTLTATPAPAVPLAVGVKVSASGNYGVAAGTGTVTIPTSGSTTFTVATSDDQTYEPDGSITATVQDGTDYSASNANGAATLTVKSDDPAPVPELSIRATRRIARSSSRALFTVSADPAPVSDVKVNVLVSTPVDYGISTGKQVFTLTTEGSSRFAVNINYVEFYAARGSVTVAIQAGEGYTVSSTHDSATASMDPLPVLSITGPGAITEGGTADFTITASPAPASPITAKLGVTQSGSFGASGAATVTVSGATTTYTVTTADDNVDEPDGSVMATLKPGSGYTVSSKQGSATATVRDNDGALSATVPEVSITAGGFAEGKRAYFRITADPAPAAELAVPLVFTTPGHTSAPASRTATLPTTGNKIVWAPVYASTFAGTIQATLSPPAANAGYAVSSAADEASLVQKSGSAPSGPVISVRRVSDATEGGQAVFQLTMLPNAHRFITVNLDIAQSGDFGASGPSTVRFGYPLPHTEFTVSTIDDNAQEADGAVHATLLPGSGYQVSFAAPSASAAVADNDAPKPEVSVTADGEVKEGQTASFTLTANPPPASPLTVTVKVSGGGHYGVAAGTRTVTIPTTGRASLKVQTQEGATHKVFETLKATLQATANYSVSSSKGAATLKVLGVSLPNLKLESMQLHIFEGQNAGFKIVSSWRNAGELQAKLQVEVSGGYVVALVPPTVNIADVITRFDISIASDDVHKPNGHVKVTLLDGPGYRLSASYRGKVDSETVNIKDDDPAPACIEQLSGNGSINRKWIRGCGSIRYAYSMCSRYFSFQITQRGSVAINAKAEERAIAIRLILRSGRSSTRGADLWKNSIAGFSNTASPNTTLDPGWYTVEVLAQCVAVGKKFTLTVAGLPAQPNIPVVSIAGGGGITEGGTASFTITASPAPSSPITVKVGVSESGSFGASGAATVTVNGASATYTVATVDDQADEADGTVTATLKDGSGYTVSPTAGSASVDVADDDDPPPVIPVVVPVVPVVSITGGSAVTEGGAATFTVTASPAPSSPITVKVGVSESGSFGASGPATATLSGAATTYTVTTTDDQVDEADGTVTATLKDGSGYTVSPTAGSATVAVADDDPPPPVVVPPVVPVEPPPEGACTGLPTVSIDDVKAKRTDATVTFEVSLDCKPGGTVTAYVAEAVDGWMVTGVMAIRLTSGSQSQTVTVNVRPTGAQSLLMGYATGAANRWAEGKVIFE